MYGNSYIVFGVDVFVNDFILAVSWEDKPAGVSGRESNYTMVHKCFKVSEKNI